MLGYARKIPLYMLLTEEETVKTSRALQQNLFVNLSTKLISIEAAETSYILYIPQHSFSLIF